MRFEHVTFGYTSTEPVLRDFDLTVAPGRDGRARRQLGFGQVDGRADAAALLRRARRARSRSTASTCATSTLDSLRRNIGVVFEDSFLFSDTITANIGFGRPDATREEIEAAARAAEAHEFILRLPHGYDTVVGEQGLTLSGGQRQRVALARALLSDPKILLLDDATSSVDSRVEEEIHATLRRIASTRTTILIAHRRSSLSLADRIVVVDQGAVLDAGTHDELWARCTLYRMLLSGPGGDAEGLEATEAERRRPSRSTASRRRRGAASTTRRSAARRSPSARAPRARRPRCASPAAAAAAAADGAAAAWGGALAPTPELLAQVDALGPATADPHVDVAFESRPSPDFKFLRFLRRYRGWLLVGHAARRARRDLHARRPAARAVRHRGTERPRRPRPSSTKSRSATASSEFAVGRAKPSAFAVMVRSSGNDVPASAPEPSGLSLSLSRASAKRPRSRAAIST